MAASEIRLLRMSLRNFKGIKEFTLEVNGQNATVYGDNAKGKTTLFDAFRWVLFGKDSANRANFAVKTTDENGNEYHGLEHEVEIDLLIDGIKHTVKKQLTEKWAKKNGETEKTFSGHENKFWVDDVPKKEKEFSAWINSIIDEAAFKLLTDPFFFSDDEKLPWEKRRKILIDIAGDISDTAIIASNPSLADLSTLLKGHSIEDLKKIVNERIKKTNEEILKIPTRIDEQNRIVEGIPNIDYTAVQTSIDADREALEDIEKIMTQAQRQAEAIGEKARAAARIQNEMNARRQELDAEARAWATRAINEKNKLDSQFYKLTGEIETTKVRISNIQERIDTKNKEIAANEQRLEELRAEYTQEADTEFPEPDPNSFTCPTCGQTLPTGARESKIQEMRDRFNRNQDRALETTQRHGNELKAKNEVTKQEVTDLQKQIEELNEQIQDKKASARDGADRAAELKKEIDAEQKRVGPVNYDTDPKYAQLKARHDAIQAELDKPAEDTTSDQIAKKRQIETRIAENNRILNNKDTAQRAKDRIQELMQEERKLSAQLSEFNRQKNMVEEFTKTKVEFIKGRINGRFKYTQFRLFIEQQNGGIQDCCDTLINSNGSWVGFKDGNHAGRVNAGLDIINALAQHYGCTAPIFIDFRESVTEIIHTASQVINLYKNENDKALRVEVGNG